MPAKVKKQKPAPPPYKLNKFPDGFSEQLAKRIIALLATKREPAISGKEWEQIFADCIGAKWQSSNVGLRDVYKDTCCWSAKTVDGGKKIDQKKKVRLISGRNNTGYSFNVDITSQDKAEDVGKKVLAIWNARVRDTKKEFMHLRKTVLIRSEDYKEYIVFEAPIISYKASDYKFEWNKNNNLEGYRRSDDEHVFTWQRDGKQFTIIEDVPEKVVCIKLKKLPKAIEAEKILKIVGYNEKTKTDWFSL